MKPTLSCQLRCSLSFRGSHATSAPVQQPLRAAYYRGGTSRALIIRPQDLPSNRAKWPNIFRQLMGSGDPYGRQLDGMGAGISSLSKICLVEPYKKTPKGREVKHKRQTSTVYGSKAVTSKNSQEDEGSVHEAHVDYTFVGLGIENDEVDVAGNCGNMSSAIGPYAYNAHILPKNMYDEGDGEITVKIRNTNTQKYIDSTFSVVGGQAAVKGDYTIDGVTGKGSQIQLDFRDPYGSKTGKVLPTGNKQDTIAGYSVTCVDGANPAIFIRADDIGVDGTVLPNDFNKLPEKLALLETIRKAAAVAMGIAKSEDEVPRTIPKIGIFSRSAAHPVLSGTTLQASEVDLVVRFISDTQPHRAIPLTAALTTAVAGRIPGTIVEQLLAPHPVMENAITIGHASGRLQVNATMDPNDKLIPLSATVYRTAKRLFEGHAYWTDEQSGLKSASHGAGHGHSLGMAFVMECRAQDSSHLFDFSSNHEDHVQENITPTIQIGHSEPNAVVDSYSSTSTEEHSVSETGPDKAFILRELDQLLRGDPKKLYWKEHAQYAYPTCLILIVAATERAAEVPPMREHQHQESVDHRGYHGPPPVPEQRSSAITNSSSGSDAQRILVTSENAVYDQGHEQQQQHYHNRTKRFNAAPEPEHTNGSSTSPQDSNTPSFPNASSPPPSIIETYQSPPASQPLSSQTPSLSQQIAALKHRIDALSQSIHPVSQSSPAQPPPRAGFAPTATSDIHADHFTMINMINTPGGSGERAQRVVEALQKGKDAGEGVVRGRRLRDAA